MLRKLLKYDLRANMKIFFFIWPAIILFALLGKLSLQADLSGRLAAIFTNLTIFMYVLALIAAVMFTLVLAITRFYSGLLRDEGYLMFTLPVKPWQLVLSKFLTALITFLVTTLLCIASALLLCSGLPGFTGALKELLTSMDSVFNAGNWILLSLTILVSCCVSLLQIYLACAFGHLFRRRRILFSVLFYYAINVILETVSVTAMVIISVSSVPDFLERLVSSLSTSGIISLIMGAMLLILTILALLYFFITERILRKRLNLE